MIRPKEKREKKQPKHKKLSNTIVLLNMKYPVILRRLIVEKNLI